MKHLEKLPESKVKIRFPDCDAFNHLNNSKYLDYFMNTREDHLLEFYDFAIHKIAREKGLCWVVAQNQISYLVPATVMETVTIQTRLLQADTRSLFVEALMWNEDKTSLKAFLWAKFVHFDLRTKKSEIHAPEFMELFKKVENPLDEMRSFEERVRALRQIKNRVPDC